MMDEPSWRKKTGAGKYLRKVFDHVADVFSFTVEEQKGLGRSGSSRSQEVSETSCNIRWSAVCETISKLTTSTPDYAFRANLANAPIALVELKTPPQLCARNPEDVPNMTDEDVLKYFCSKESACTSDQLYERCALTCRCRTGASFLDHYILQAHPARCPALHS